MPNSTVNSTVNTPALDREGWLIEAGNLISEDIIYPHSEGRETPLFRVSVGFPKGRSTKTVAVCYKTEVSEDRHSEIFVTPAIDDSATILAALTHELIHAYDDCASGHRGFFSRCAHNVGLQKPMTATTADEQLTAKLQDIIDILGNIPHAKMNRNLIKKQKTKMIKCECSKCNFIFRTTQKWIDNGLEDYCIACGATYVLLFGE